MFLLKDGVKYNLWQPQKESQLEEVLMEHFKEVFGGDAVYFNVKKVIESNAKIASIPDAYVIHITQPRKWSIIEVELSSHDVFSHIVPQISKFAHGIKNDATRRKIIKILHAEIKGKPILEAWVKEKIGSGEIHEFLSNIIFEDPDLIIVVDKKTKQLEEAVQSQPFRSNILEVKTFRRKGAEAVHIHSFPTVERGIRAPSLEPSKKEVKKEVTIVHLVDRGIVKPGDVFRAEYKDKSYTATVTKSGMLDADGKEYRYPSGASYHATNGSFTGSGWLFWKYKDPDSGTLKPIAELRARITGDIKKWLVHEE